MTTSDDPPPNGAAVGARRPGGRTARTRDRVFDAVRSLIDDERPIVFGEVADRSGVHLTTLYRRWSSPAGLTIDVLREEIEPFEPVAEQTADLRSALESYARDLAARVMTRRGAAYLGALTRAAVDPRSSETIHTTVVGQRVAFYEALLRAWPQSRLTPRDLLDGLFAPLSMHAVLATSFTAEGAEVSQYVDNLVRLSGERLRESPGTIAERSPTTSK